MSPELSKLASLQVCFSSVFTGDLPTIHFNETAAPAGMDGIQNALQNIYQTLQDNAQGVNERFDGIENRLDGIENRLDGIENRLALTEIKVSHLSCML
jgi:hypothetical protein